MFVISDAAIIIVFLSSVLAALIAFSSNIIYMFYKENGLLSF